MTDKAHRNDAFNLMVKSAIDEVKNMSVKDLEEALYGHFSSPLPDYGCSRRQNKSYYDDLPDDFLIRRTGRLSGIRTPSWIFDELKGIEKRKDRVPLIRKNRLLDITSIE